MLSLAVHTLFGQQWEYHAVAGAAVITAALYGLKTLVSRWMRAEGVASVFAYIPSMLLLAALGDVTERGGSVVVGGLWRWLLPVSLVSFCGVVMLVRRLTPAYLRAEKRRNFYGDLWRALGLLALMCCCVGVSGRGGDVLRYRVRMERLLMEGRSAEALEVGRRSLAADTSLTSLRLYALAREHRVGERLFAYPIVGGTHSLLPDGRTVRWLMLPCLREADLGSLAGDYQLARALMRRDLETFARLLPTLYPMDRRLPRHYAEALTLCRHLHAVQTGAWSDPVMEADYQDFQSLADSEPDPALRRSRLRDTYSATYWYYYECP